MRALRMRARTRHREIPVRPEDLQVDDLQQTLAREPAQVVALLGPALDELSAMERAAFVLRHYEGLGIEEISAALGVEPGAAHVARTKYSAIGAGIMRLGDSRHGERLKHQQQTSNRRGAQPRHGPRCGFRGPPARW